MQKEAPAVSLEEIVARVEAGARSVARDARYVGEAAVHSDLLEEGSYEVVVRERGQSKRVSVAAPLGMVPGSAMAFAAVAKEAVKLARQR